MRTKKENQIVETAKELFLKHGTKRISVEEISRSANVSKMTFYKYFDNKKALIKEIRNDFLDYGFSKFDEIDAMDIPYEKKIALMSKWRMEYMKSIQSEFLDDIISFDDFNNQYTKRFIKGIKTAQLKGEIKKNISPELISLISDKMREITIDGAWREIFEDYATYQDQVRTIIFTGILNVKGQEEGEKYAGT